MITKEREKLIRIGHIDLTHLGKVSPDFFISNCHK